MRQLAHQSVGLATLSYSSSRQQSTRKIIKSATANQTWVPLAQIQPYTLINKVLATSAPHDPSVAIFLCNIPNLCAIFQTSAPHDPSPELQNSICSHFHPLHRQRTSHCSCPTLHTLNPMKLSTSISPNSLNYETRCLADPANDESILKVWFWTRAKIGYKAQRRWWW